MSSVTQNKWISFSLSNKIVVGDLLFYLLTSLYLVFLYSYIPELHPVASLVPKLVIFVSLLFCALGLVKLTLSMLNYTGVTSAFENLMYTIEQPDGIDEEDIAEIKSYASSTVIHMGGVLVYMLALTNIGFFTSTLVFSTLYIFYKERSVLKSILAGIGITAFLYVVFVVILGERIVLRLGVVV